MSMKFNTTLPSPTELKEEYPLSEKLAELKKKRDQEIRDIFTENRTNLQSLSDRVLQIMKIQCVSM